MGGAAEYEKIRVVGRGAYGVVHLCRRRADGNMVIIKQIPVEEMTKEERQAALTEVKVLDMLQHPNIIAYYDSFVEDKALMIVMEYAEGGTIFECVLGTSAIPSPYHHHYCSSVNVDSNAPHTHLRRIIYTHSVAWRPHAPSSSNPMKL